MNLRSQNLFLSIVCALLLMAVIALMVWMWFGENIEHVDSQMKSLQR
ncbi:MAG TPA: hypothetical protein VFG10_16395 [Saprospiraceae bacterium]|nr:hypothetical protein [Saprospiraceae bacterium]